MVPTIGARFVMSKMTLDDAYVCRKGMSALLEALAELRRNGATGRLHIMVCSTTGMSRFGRDTPLVIAPLYHVLLKVPHKDKRAMEDSLAASDENYTIVHATWLTNGEAD